MEDWRQYLITGDPLDFDGQLQADREHSRLAVNNELYLGERSDLKAILSLLFQAVLTERPTSPIKFMAHFFDDQSVRERVLNFNQS